MLNFDSLQKSLGLAFPSHFMSDFRKKEFDLNFKLSLKLQWSCAQDLFGL